MSEIECVFRKCIDCGVDVLCLVNTETPPNKDTHQNCTAATAAASPEEDTNG